MKKIIDLFRHTFNTPYMIGEIGINHNGDINIAKTLIDALNACGWHSAKFQKRNPDVCVPEHQKNITRDTPWGKIKYIDYKHKIEFGPKEYETINDYCLEKSMDWSISVWDIDSLNFALNYDLPYIKIPSAHITNNELLEESARSNIPIILSTGMSNWAMVDNAVEILGKTTNEFAVLHCNSTYPAPIDELHLNVIPEMKKRYGCIIGYSGHEYNLEPSVLAVAMGAQIIERHITLDHNMWGTDQGSSLEVHAMDLLYKRIKEVNKILGSNEKIITDTEKPNLRKLRG
jgi:N-acetylneuraminate synthase